MLRNIQGWPLVIIILAVIILVGWKRLPDAARSVGRSMRILKSEVEQMGGDKDDKDEKPSAASTDTVDGKAKNTAEERTSADDEAAAPQGEDRPNT